MFSGSMTDQKITFGIKLAAAIETRRRREGVELSNLKNHNFGGNPERLIVNIMYV